MSKGRKCSLCCVRDIGRSFWKEFEMSNEEVEERFVNAVRQIDGHCATLLDRESEDNDLKDARCLIGSVLMRAVGISRFLAETLQEGPQVGLRALRIKIYDAFGSPGDWGYESSLRRALSALYAIPLTAYSPDAVTS